MAPTSRRASASDELAGVRSCSWASGTTNERGKPHSAPVLQFLMVTSLGFIVGVSLSRLGGWHLSKRLTLHSESIPILRQNTHGLQQPLQA